MQTLHKRETMVEKTLHRKLTIEQNKSHKKPGGIRTSKIPPSQKRTLEKSEPQSRMNTPETRT